MARFSYLWENTLDYIYLTFIFIDNRLEFIRGFSKLGNTCYIIMSIKYWFVALAWQFYEACFVLESLENLKKLLTQNMIN